MRRSIGVLLIAAAFVPAAPSATAASCGARTRTRTRTAVAPPYGGSACPGVRPGAYVSSDLGGCTLGFLFTGSDRRRYAATAGHCGTTEGTEMTWPAGKGPIASDAAAKPIGRFAYAVSIGDNDFALIRLDKGVASDPQMCHFGGPTGINAEVHTDPIELRHFGQALGESLTPARTAEAPLGLVRPEYTYAWGVAYNGDSGSPVTDAGGQAIGVITELKASGLGDIGINRLGPRLAQAQAKLRIKFTLLTAPTL